MAGPCPRCGRAQPPTGGPAPGSTRACVHCGRLLGGVRWVASPPDAFRPRERAAPPARYAGPPRYREVPRWSLWPWAAAPPPGSPDGPVVRAGAPGAEQVLHARAGLLRRLALTTVILAVLAAAGEGWRYTLLLASRSHALTATPLNFSDALVTLTGLLTPAAALVTGVVFLRWLLAARAIAADVSGTRPARGRTATVAGCVLPPATLVVPGAVLTEIEHAAAGRPGGERPRPSRPVAVFWGAWAGSVLLGLVAVLQGLGSSTQAMADGVVLHGVVDLAAAGAALATLAVSAHLTELLAPTLRPRGRDWVVRVLEPR